VTVKILDEYQRTAIYWPPTKSVIIKAPPGHGKTFVMARRIEYILQSGFIRTPQKILGLTFTNAAAGEMMDDIRIQLSLTQQSLVRVMTFHSFCYKVLHAYGNLIGLDRNFVILGELQQQKILGSIFSTIIGVPPDADAVKKCQEAYQELVKEKLLKMNPDYTHPTQQQILDQAIIEYDKKMGSNLVDYNHLLKKTIVLFETTPEILVWYRSTFRYILVDEFQDTNPLQLKLLSLLVNGDYSHPSTLPNSHVFILTDPEQAIFRFQGATPENIEIAKDKFKCEEMSLHVNYRTNNPKIIALTKRMRKEPYTEPAEKIPFFISQSPKEEAQLILTKIKQHPGALHDICVIAQSSYNFEELKSVFEEQSIPFVFVPDYKAKSVEMKYGAIFDSIGQIVVAKNSNGKLTSKLLKIFEDGFQDWRKDEVLIALFDLAMNFERSVTGNSLSEKARQFYNDIFIEINWGNLLRKRVRNKVFLSTIHGVKGLQFPQVHFIGLVNYEHIHSNICYPCNGGKEFSKFITALKEPFSTLYVGASRAQEELFLYGVRKNRKNKNRNLICLLSYLRDVINVPQDIPICGQAYRSPRK
jgi:superfamily I DNA/RNA helicase